MSSRVCDSAIISESSFYLRSSATVFIDTPVPEPSEVVFVAGIGLLGFGLVKLKIARACGG